MQINTEKNRVVAGHTANHDRAARTAIGGAPNMRSRNGDGVAVAYPRGLERAGDLATGDETLAAPNWCYLPAGRSLTERQHPDVLQLPS